MDLVEIRSRILAGEPFRSLDEERFYISSIRRGYTGALETRAASVKKADSAKERKTGKTGLSDAAMNDLLGSI